MSKIKQAFDSGKAFISFITCGDPSLDITKKLIVEMEKAGADIIELGIPFSDPTAEGPVIQSANERALAQGVTTDKIFDMVEQVSPEIEIPLVFMTYANVLFSYGIEKFVKRSKEIGISGIILPDIPFEEKEEFSSICDAYDIDFISLITPASNDRIEMIAKEARGFVYCVSSMGVTGTRSSFDSSLENMVSLVRQNSSCKTAIGFGISNEEQARAMSKIADGVIVGSAIVKICEKYKENCVPYVAQFVKNMKNAIK